MLVITFKNSEAISDASFRHCRASSFVTVVSRVFDCLVSCTLFRAFDIAAEDRGRPQEVINAIHAAFEAN